MSSRISACPIHRPLSWTAVQEIKDSAGSELVYVHRVINRRRRRIETDDSAIFAILTAHFLVRAVFTSLYDARDLCEYRVVELLGAHENVVMAEYVYHRP